MDSQLNIQMRKLEQPLNLRLDADLPIIIRVDGHNFHQYIHNFSGHFDTKMQTIMIKSMIYVMSNISDISFGYTNSDEITFIILPHNGNNFMSNRVLKLTSIIASMVTAKFNTLMPSDQLAWFDTRVFNATISDTFQVLKWRQLSGQRNAISTYAREFLSASQMSKKSSSKLESVLQDYGIPRLPRDVFYYGYFVAHVTSYPLICNVAHGDIVEIANVYMSKLES